MTLGARVAEQPGYSPKPGRQVPQSAVWSKPAGHCSQVFPNQELRQTQLQEPLTPLMLCARSLQSESTQGCRGEGVAGAREEAFGGQKFMAMLGIQQVCDGGRKVGWGVEAGEDVGHVGSLYLGFGLMPRTIT